MRKKSLGFSIFNCFNMAFMVLACAIILYPYLHVLVVALNDNANTAYTGMMLFPRKPTLMNFRALLSDGAIWHSAGVTLSRLLVGVPLTIFINFTGSYALSKSYLPGRRAMVLLLMIPSYISAGLIPTYILYARLHLLNSFWVYVLPVGFWFFGFILLRTYMYTIPESLEESAKLDGANDFMILLRIYLPLSLPIIATLVLFSAVTHWNDWTTTLYFVTNYRGLSTLAFELERVLREQDRVAKLIQEAIVHGTIPPSASSGTSEGLRNAQIIITTLPIIAVYPFLQKYFIQGIMVGSVKG
jgi:putative aldouronate transport system permease protein